MNEVEKHVKMIEPILLALVELFHPLLEVAIHDLKKGTILAIYHNISKRKVGDPSPLHELEIPTQDFPDYFSPYFKTNWDGRPLKCTSVTLRNTQKKAIGLICFNTDVSVMSEIHTFMGSLLKVKEQALNPIELHGQGMEEQATQIIEKYLLENQLRLNFLDRDQKKALLSHLYHKGILNFKKAIPFISKFLKISRASVYNYLQEIEGSMRE